MTMQSLTIPQPSWSPVVQVEGSERHHLHLRIAPAPLRPRNEDIYNQPSENLQDPPSCHVMHPSSKPAGLQKSAPVKRGPGRPRKDASIKPTPGVRKQSGSASRSETTYRRVASDKTRASRGLRSIRGQSAASLDDPIPCSSSGTAQDVDSTFRNLLASRSRLDSTSLWLSVRPKWLLSQSSQLQQSLQKGYGSGSNESHQHVSFVPAKAASPRGNLKHSRPQIVRSPFSFASQGPEERCAVAFIAPTEDQRSCLPGHTWASWLRNPNLRAITSSCDAFYHTCLGTARSHLRLN